MILLYERVGFDIDNCITNLDLTLEIMADYYNQPTPKIDDITDYNLSSVFGITAEESRVFWEEMEYELCAGAEMNQERLDRLFRLFTHGDTEVYIITNRDIKYYDITKKWLQDNLIPFDKLIMTSGVSKVDVLKRFDIELMVDDKPDLFEEAKAAGLKTKMVCIDYPYNRHVDCDMRLSREGRGIAHTH